MEKIQQYKELRSLILSSEQSIMDRKSQIEKLNEQIQFADEFITSTSEKLAAEDLALSRNSRLKPPTMDIAEYEAAKDAIERYREQRIGYEESMAFHKRALILEESELKERRRAFYGVRDLILIDLADQSMTDFVASAGDSFKKLIMSIIAVEGKGKGFNHTQKVAFKSEIYRIVFDEIVPVVFTDTKELPDLGECNRFVDGLIERAA